MRILIVHKDRDFVRQINNILEGRLGFDDAIHNVATLDDAMNLGDYDLTLIDVCTVEKPMTAIESAKPIADYARMHPRTTVVVHSTVSKGTTANICEMVLEDLPKAKIRPLDCMARIAEIEYALTSV